MYIELPEILLYITSFARLRVSPNRLEIETEIWKINE